MMSSEYYAKVKTALRKEREIEKQRLRNALHLGDNAAIFQYCVGSSKKFRQAMENQLMFGQGKVEVTDTDARWALRYYRRLMGRPVAG